MDRRRRHSSSSAAKPTLPRPTFGAALGSEVVRETVRQRKRCAFAGDLGKQVRSGRAPLVTLSHEPNLSVGPIAKRFIRRATTATEVRFLHTCNGAAGARTELDITLLFARDHPLEPPRCASAGVPSEGGSPDLIRRRRSGKNVRGAFATRLLSTGPPNLRRSPFRSIKSAG